MVLLESVFDGILDDVGEDYVRREYHSGCMLMLCGERSNIL